MASPLAGPASQPVRQVAGVAGKGFDALLVQILLHAIKDQGLRDQLAVIRVAQVQQSAAGLADAHGFIEHALQQAIEAFLRRQAGGDFEEAGDGLFHSIHGHGQAIDFQ